LSHVIDGAASVVGMDRVVVLTSDLPSDDPIAAYCASRVSVFRGALDDVYTRYLDALRAYPCGWFFRLTADSPLVNVQVMQAMLQHPREDADLLTNTCPRSFPIGRSAELIRAAAFEAVRPASLTEHQREHVTQYLLAGDRERIVNFSCGNEGLATTSVAIDTIDDLRRLEEMDIEDPAVLGALA
jgi:spore coat polysaccharide biosynthesis protein SpsF